MRVLKLLISGKQGSGKTSTGHELKHVMSKKGWSVEMITFAEVIYRMHDSCNRILQEYGIDRNLVKDGNLLQLLGTEWGRNTISENIWVDCTINKIKALEKLHESRGDKKLLFIITDARFPNEFDAFSGENDLRIRLECEKLIRMKRCEMWRDKDCHPSEVGLDIHSERGDFDLILNTGEVSIGEALTLIQAQIDKNSWSRKRAG